jgi:hypothetical protein
MHVNRNSTRLDPLASGILRDISGLGTSHRPLAVPAVAISRSSSLHCGCPEGLEGDEDGCDDVADGFALSSKGCKMESHENWVVAVLSLSSRGTPVYRISCRGRRILAHSCGISLGGTFH